MRNAGGLSYAAFASSKPGSPSGAAAHCSAPYCWDFVFASEDLAAGISRVTLDAGAQAIRSPAGAARQ
jgi:hypothetical protein